MVRSRSGVTAGTARQSRPTAPKTVFSRRSSLNQAPAGAGLVVGRHPVVGLGQGPLGVRHPVELEVVVVRDALVQAGQNVVERCRPLVGVQDERVHAAQGDLGDHADRADADQGGREDVGLVSREQRMTSPVPVTSSSSYESGQAAVAGAGAVGAGGQRAGDRLHVDVAEVGHGQAVPGELDVERGRAWCRPAPAPARAPRSDA